MSGIYFCIYVGMHLYIPVYQVYIPGFLILINPTWPLGRRFLFLSEVPVMYIYIYIYIYTHTYIYANATLSWNSARTLGPCKVHLTLQIHMYTIYELSHTCRHTCTPMLWQSAEVTDYTRKTCWEMQKRTPTKPMQANAGNALSLSLFSLS